MVTWNLEYHAILPLHWGTILYWKYYQCSCSIPLQRYMVVCGNSPRKVCIASVCKLISLSQTLISRHLPSFLIHPCIIHWGTDAISYWSLLTNLPLVLHMMSQWIGWTLVQVMAWRLFGAKPLPEPVLNYCHWTLRDKLQWNQNSNTKLVIHEAAFANVVWEMMAILFRETWLIKGSGKQWLECCIEILRIYLSGHYTESKMNQVRSVSIFKSMTSH